MDKTKLEIFTMYENFEDAKIEIKREEKKKLENIIDDLTTNDYLDILNDYSGCDVRSMKELDECFYDYSVTDVLTELCEIDVNEEYFERYDKTSADYAWNLTTYDEDDLLSDLIDGYYETYIPQIAEIIEEYDEILKEVEKTYKNKKINTYFEKLLSEYGADEMYIILSRAF